MRTVKMKIYLSIVIANYNYGRFLSTALDSVISQCEEPVFREDGRAVLPVSDGAVELIVVDGASTDNSVEVIHRYSRYISWWVSEKDKGQSDAFNKGFAHAKGMLLTWLNADDFMVPRSVEKVIKCMQQYPGVEWFAGGSLSVNDKLEVIKCTEARPMHRSRANKGNCNVYAASSFFSKRLLSAVGGVNIDFHYHMDTLLWLQFYFDLKQMYINLPGYYFVARIHPDAKVNGVWEYNKPIPPRSIEERRFIVTHYPSERINKWRQIFSRDILYLCRSFFDTCRFRGEKYERIKSLLR